MRDDDGNERNWQHKTCILHFFGSFFINDINVSAFTVNVYFKLWMKKVTCPPYEQVAPEALGNIRDAIFQILSGLQLSWTFISFSFLKMIS